MAYTTIKKPSDYFNSNLYTGNNTETSHTVGFQPDFTWLKVRNADGSHYLFDSVRLATKYLQADTTSAEGTDTNLLKSFNSNGYTIGTSNAVNSTGETMVGWNWLGANGTAANTDGTISSTVSANTTAGFSVVKFTATGANGTIGHGLGVAPKMIITKNLSITKDWSVYHSSLGAGKSIFLNTTAVADTDNSYWNNTAPTSTTFSYGTWSGNNNGNEIIAYCFAEKQGYSKFGSYTGNGNASDNTFVYTGFKVGWVLIKRSSSAGEGWFIFDSTRSPANLNVNELRADVSTAETTGSHYIDFLSNGFKPKTNGAGIGGSGDTYIYMAFAEEPLVGDNPATAR
jgi:hypothetical protein